MAVGCCCPFDYVGRWIWVGVSRHAVTCLHRGTESQSPSSLLCSALPLAAASTSIRRTRLQASFHRRPLHSTSKQFFSHTSRRRRSPLLYSTSVDWRSISDLQSFLLLVVQTFRGVKVPKVRMRFAVKQVCAGGAKARAGLLQIGNSSIDTPALLLSTRKGLPAFMSCDLLSSLPLPDSLLLNVCPTHFIEGPPSKTLSNIGGLHRMLGLPDHILVASAGEPIESLPSSEASNKFGASFETPAGRKLVKPSDYMELISCMKPNLWASLADEVPAWVNEKRNKTSVDRTLRWLDACIALDAAAGENSLGIVVGGSNIEQRKLCATEVSKRNVSGFWIGGFGLGESVEERCNLLNAVTDCLPLEKPRIVSRLGLPEEVLEGVASGIDLFDSTYIYQLTMGGFALIFPVDTVEREMQNGVFNSSAGDSVKINLRATTYRKDTSPIVESCSCFTCQNHTRAYLNHLLNVHEMLAQILLEIHNTHHYLRFFRSIREAIKVGEFDLFWKQFVENRRSQIAAAAAAAL